MTAPKGKVYLVGAGPGDPGLLTLRGKELIERADVILYDSLANSVLLDLAPPGAIKIHVGKRAGRHLVPQAEIQALLVSYAAEGKTVIRLKGGDPVLFGRGAEEAAFLFQEGIAFEIVPGVPSAFAVPIYAGIPVTHRECASSVTVVTGHGKPDREEDRIDWAGLVRALNHHGTIVILMGLKSLPAIVQRLIEEGAPPEMPSATIVSGTYAHQKRVIGDLETLPALVEKADLQPPALTIIGPVVRSWGQLDWFQSRPLFGRRIVVTRPRGQSSSLSDPLRELGADVLELPVITIRQLPPVGPLLDAIHQLDRYDWLVFTSPNGVHHFLHSVMEKCGDIRGLCGPRLAAIGPGTASALRDYHLPCDLIPDSAYQQEGLVEAFDALPLRPGSASKGRVLIPRAKEARSALQEGLRKQGWSVDVVPVYETVGTPVEEIMGAIESIERDGVDWVTLTSSSTARHFARLLESKVLKAIPGNVRYASIGPITTDTARECGLPIAAEAATSSIDGLIEILAQRA